MAKVKVAVVGYGVIGQRLADGVEKQEDMKLLGIVDVAPTLSIRALYDSDSPYDVYVVNDSMRGAFEAEGIPIKGNLNDILSEADIVLDATPAGVGAKNKELYLKAKKKAIFQGGEKDEVADVFFHGYANYEKGIGADYLKLTSCNTTGFIRAVDCIDKEVGVERVVVTIIRRSADPGDIHRGVVDLALVEKVPNHQAVDLMKIMPHIDATGALVHVPTTHGHIITLLVTPKKKISVDDALKLFEAHPRIKVVEIEKGFNSNAALFRYARDRGSKRADMYEIALFKETLVLSGNNLFFTISVPQEAVVTPETIDGIRASLKLQTNWKEAVSLTNKYLKME
ncbi:MAG: type II glyceraldehyde-3-phosphate dehydrogenase [Actinobacteria bacterium]|nr:type II glyceraldehyde-3-phosphate dehydrogenase [Actinomycetota bacterium]